MSPAMVAAAAVTGSGERRPRDAGVDDLSRIAGSADLRIHTAAFADYVSQKTLNKKDRDSHAED